jgi:hypothetical protein
MNGAPSSEFLVCACDDGETVGELDAYPATTATSSGGLHGGELFTCRLKEAVKACAVRVTGKPACGDNPQQSFSSCAELQAFAR